MNINKTELTKIIIEQAGELADAVVDMLRACGEHGTGGHVSLKVRARPNKAGKLVVESTITSREPSGADTDEIFRGIPCPIATMDMDEEHGQEHISEVEQ
jgi:hypothetical protein